MWVAGIRRQSQNEFGGNLCGRKVVVKIGDILYTGSLNK